MDCPTEIKNVFVSSEKRNTTQFPNGNSYTLHLTNPIKSISKAELLSLSVPNTIFNLENGTNVIAFSNTWTSQGVAGSSDTSDLTFFSIPSGFYSASGIANEIQYAVSNSTSISIRYLGNEGKFMFSRPTSGNTFSMYITSSELADLLGFESSNTGVLVNSTNVAVDTSLFKPLYSDNALYNDKNFLKSDKVLDLSKNKGIFLDIEELRTPLNEEAIGLNGESSGTFTGQVMTRSFGMIPMDVPSGSIKNFKKSSDYDLCIDYPYPIEKLNRLTIKWVDSDGQMVNFNGLDDNSFILRLHTTKKNMCLR
jgi:hypothetical protein